VGPRLFELGRSDPFFEISRKYTDHTTGVVRWYVVLDSANANQVKVFSRVVVVVVVVDLS
jgi:hypothetical protein